MVSHGWLKWRRKRAAVPRVLGTLLLAFVSSFGLAQSPLTGAPDADAQWQLQQQREAEQRRVLERRPEVRLPSSSITVSERLRDDEKPCFVVREVRLSGVRDWPELASRSWAFSGPGGDDSPVGRCLGASSIGTVAARLQSALVGAGFITTRVLVPAQDLSTGVLELTVIPGRIHAVRLREGSSEQVRLSNALPLRSGDLLNLRGMEQALENLQRVPSAKVDIQVEPAGEAAEPGMSDLVVSYEGRRQARVQFQVDDSGSSSTGRYPVSATMSLDHPLLLNDLFYVTVNRDVDWLWSAIRSRPSPHPSVGGHVLHYSLPWGYSQISVTFSRNGYRQVVVGAAQDYVYRGTSSSGELKLAHMLWRNQQFKVQAWSKFFGRGSRNFIDDTEVEVQRRRVGGWELGLNLKRVSDDVNGEAEVSLKRGTGLFHALPAPEEAFGEGTSRVRLAQGSASLSGALPLGGTRVQLSTQWRGQVALQPLTPQDRFAIGGRYTVRGFGSDRTLTADHGLLMRNEAELPLREQLSTYLGLDAGWVSGRGVERLAGRHLSGAVLGARWRHVGVQLDVFAGTALQRPSNFPSGQWVAGFSLSYSP